MIDERLKTRDESGSTSSPTKRHPEHREGSIMHLSTLSLSKGLLLISFLFLAACTDYVQKMDDDFNEWEQAQQQAELSSSSQVVMSSSSIKSSKSSSSVFLSSDSHEKSSNSSKEKVSSSSNKKTSSSSAKIESSSIAGSIYDASKKLLTDLRDSQSYKTVVIGSQTWMAQNLNYKTANSFCYNDSTKYCTKYGRLYTWASAMDSIGIWSTNGKGCGNGITCSRTYPLRGACPFGWHLPTRDEFRTLFTAVGGQSTAGVKLRSINGWDSDVGTDLYAFSALPAGLKNLDGNYSGQGNNVHFWSSTEDSQSLVYFVYMISGQDKVNLVNGYKHSGQSVRCIKDDSLQQNSSSSITSVVPVPRDSLIDTRDGQVYKIASIGSQKWMAKNLNYETANSYCYDDNKSNCTKYGRLYTWSAAMDSVGKWSKKGKGCGSGTSCSPTGNIQGVCPTGWHLPTKVEFEVLINAAGGKSIAAQRLKSSSGGWRGYDYGTDAYEFSALPAGKKDSDSFSSLDEYTHFWSSSEDSSSNYYAYRMFFNGNNDANIVNNSKKDGLSVRCVKD